MSHNFWPMVKFFLKWTSLVVTELIQMRGLMWEIYEVIDRAQGETKQCKIVGDAKRNYDLIWKFFQRENGEKIINTKGKNERSNKKCSLEENNMSIKRKRTKKQNTSKSKYGQPTRRAHSKCSEASRHKLFLYCLP